MLDPISDLDEVLHLYGPVNMLAMDPRDFEKYFGRIHAAVNLFRAQPHAATQAARVVQTTCQLLERAGEHHRTESRSATSDAVKIYDDIVLMLDQILMVDLRMTEGNYENARKKSLALNALMACGIVPPGYQATSYTSRFANEDENEARRAKAFHYVRDNIEEFTRFVFDLAYNHKYVLDPFLSGGDSVALDLFQRVKSLRPGFTMIEGPPSLGNA